MSWLPHRFGSSARVALVVSLEIIAGADGLHAGDDQKNLQLEVSINGVPRNAIGSFVQLTDGHIAAARNELEELGINVGSRPNNDLVQLREIATLQYRYEEQTQKIDITVDNAQRSTSNYDLRKSFAPSAPPSPAGFGSVLNYNLFSTTSSFQQTRTLSLASTSLTLDARAFSPYGSLNQSAILRSIGNYGTEALRLETSYRYSDPERLVSYRAGDAVVGGLPWTRPIRIGGLQAQRNFLLRPDLVTTPLASLGGTAAVPSTVDLYINNIRTFSENVSAGPFSLSNVPTISGSGNARIVVRDAAGHETSSTLPFYSSPSLLAPGLMSFSVDAGFPRLSYGSPSDTYGKSPVAAATLRRGISDGLTVEAHAEGGSGLVNGGAGIVFLTGTIGVASAALSGSAHTKSLGLQSALSFETNLFGVQLNLSSQRTFKKYEDLASVTARLQENSLGLSPTGYLGLFNYTSPSTSAIFTGLSNMPPRALDRVGVSMPVPFDNKAAIGATYIHLRDPAGIVSNIISGTWSRTLPYNATGFASVFTDLGTKKNTGIFFGLSYPFSDSISVGSSVSTGKGGTTIGFDAAKALGTSAGSVGWRIHDSEGAVPYREAAVAYRSSAARIQAGVSEIRGNMRGTIEVEGSVVTMAGGVFLSNRVDDGFAVVETGVPGVQVLIENRSIGVTDSAGRLLVPTLRSFQSNKITIDPAKLPVDIIIENTREVVAPADRAGVLVNFRLQKESTAALVVFTGADGGFIPAGSSGRVEGGYDFVIGYDGQAYISKLGSMNSVKIDLGDKPCNANFRFAPINGEQVRIGPVVCQ